MSPPLEPADQSDAGNGNPVSQTPAPNSPRSRPGAIRKYTLYYAIGAIVLLAIVVALVFMSLSRYFLGAPYAGPVFEAKRQKLQVTIVERGSLESAENSDVVVRVKAGAKGSTNASIIKWVVEDGTRVKAGDRIVELDDSGYQDILKTQRNTVNAKQSDWIQVKQECEIQEIQNEIDIKTAEVKVIQAGLELKNYAGYIAAAKMAVIETQVDIRKYLKGAFEKDVRQESAEFGDKFTCTYLQEVSDLEGKIENARSDRESWLDRAAWSQRMVKKGLYSASQAESDQSRLASMEISLRMTEGNLDIYRKFILESKVTSKWSDLKEAERNFLKTKKQAAAKTEQKKADEAAKRSIYDQEIDRLHDMEKDEKFYKVDSPQDGMIVYYIPEQARFGGGSQQSTVAQGEPVREGQKLMRIPNLRKMLVNARVHEAMVSKVKPERTVATQYSEILRFTSSFGHANPFNLVSEYTMFDDLRERYRDSKEFKDKDARVLFAGQKARIRVEAFPGKQYQGRVKSKATVASQAEFFSSDVKVYQTMVSIDDLDADSVLNPGMSAEVTILADETEEPVLIIPIQSVVGNVSKGANRKCFVLDKSGYAQERDIVVGLSSDKYVEVIAGLAENEKVVLSPRLLLPEKSDLKPGIPGARRGADFDDDGGKKKGAGKKADGAGKGGKGLDGQK